MLTEESLTVFVIFAA